METVVVLKPYKSATKFESQQEPRKHFRRFSKRTLAFATLGLVFVLVYVCVLMCVLLFVKVGEVNRSIDVQDRVLSDLLRWKELSESEIQQRQTIDRQRNKRAFRRLPWIKLSGPAKERPGLDMPSGNFIWKPKSAADLSAFGDYSSSLEKEALLIRCPGAYYVFADIRLNGRRFEDGNVYHPYIGIELVRKSFGETEWNILTRGYITQDNLGFSGGQLGIDARPVDTFGLRDLVSFECGDEVKVRLVEGTIVDVNNDQFLLTEDQAQFGMFMVEEHGDHCPLCSAYS